jgi:hypothetical protein
MSVKVMSWVWEQGPGDATMKLVLLALADIADDEGKCWPSVVRVAQRGCMSERNARRIIRKLEEGGWLQVEQHPGRNKTNTYWIAKPDKALSALTDCPPGQMEQENRTNSAQKPDKALSAKPSRTIKEPSEDISERDQVRLCLEAWASPDAVSSFIAYRRKKKGGALTITAAKRMATHLKAIFNAGGDPSDALGLAEERNWQTVEADWYFNAKGKPNGNRNHNTGRAASSGGDRFLDEITLAARARPSSGGFGH